MVVVFEIRPRLITHPSVKPMKIDTPGRQQPLANMPKATPARQVDGGRVVVGGTVGIKMVLVHQPRRYR